MREILRFGGGSLSLAGGNIRNLRPRLSKNILSPSNILSPVPLRSPITLDTRCTRCGSSSLWRSSGEVVDFGLWRQRIAPQDLQNSSFFVLSFCMVHFPHAGHGGSPRTLDPALGVVLGRLFLATNQPFFGRLTLGMIIPRWSSLKSLTRK